MKSKREERGKAESGGGKAEGEKRKAESGNGENRKAARRSACHAVAGGRRREKTLASATTGEHCGCMKAGQSIERTPCSTQVLVLLMAFVGLGAWIVSHYERPPVGLAFQGSPTVSSTGFSFVLTN